MVSPAEREDHVIREFLDRVVASVFAVDTVLLKLPTRGRKPVAEARQVAMYLAHVACGLSFTRVGTIFGRDRTTVSHACKRVEDRREDVEFDNAIDLLERTIRMIHLEEAGRCER
jgi:chromosomal replication initiation ATPase DnaA